MSKRIVTGPDARAGLKRGVDQLCNAVGVTLGPNGRNVMYRNQHGADVITKDGVSIAEEVSPEDTLENMGANVALQAAKRTVLLGGDGTTTTLVLTQGFVDVGTKLASEVSTSSIEVKRTMDRLKDDILAELDKFVLPVENQISNIANISTNGDTVLASYVVNAFSKVGKTGVVNVKETNKQFTSVEVASGMKIEAGFTNSYFINNVVKNHAELKNPRILLHSGKIDGIVRLTSLLEQLIEIGYPLLIITDDIDPQVLNTFILNNLQGHLKCCIVKTPSIGERYDNLTDIGKYTGATIVGDNIGINLDSITLDHLGTCQTVVVSKKETIIQGDNPSQEHAEDLLKRANDPDVHQEVRDNYLQRYANYTTGVAEIHVGGNTPVEIKEMHDRLDDAVKAVKSAIEDGVVPGGGSVLCKIGHLLWAGSNDKSYRELAKVLYTPLVRMLKNGEVSDTLVEEMVKDTCTSAKPTGYNLRNNQRCNLVDSGIVDPMRVIKVAVEGAISVAGMIISTETVLVEND
jgi:chaperonin GroEL